MFAHPPAHISQPPHTAGQPFKGLRTSIDPTQIPSPIEAIESEKEEWEDKTYTTLPGSHVPMASTDFLAIDQGNSSPKFIRMSTWNLPSSSRLASECSIPIAAVIQPFAEPDMDEEVPVVETGPAGPARCTRCRGYINPWCTWTGGGNRWKCNLCARETEVSSEYFCNLDANLLRLDHLQRPELNKGTVDFSVPEEYWSSHPPPRIAKAYHSPTDSQSGRRTPQPLKYVFLLDVSHESVRSGFLQASCSAIKTALFGLENVSSGLPPENTVAIITFDDTLHFYDLTSSLDVPPVYVVPDLEETFAPIHTGLFVQPTEFRAAIESLLNALPARYADTPTASAALGSAIYGAAAALNSSGGLVLAFLSTMPTVGTGHLNRDLPQEAPDSDKEWKQFVPRESAWNDIGELCVEEGIGVSLLLGMSKPIDIGSIGIVPAMTGGDIFFHPRFDISRDSYALENQLYRVFHRLTVFNCSLKIRCSSGLSVTSIYGNFVPRAGDEAELGVLDADKAIAASFDHTGKLDAREYAYIQVATLHTTLAGERRVRVLNLALQVADLAGNVFRYADIDGTLSFSVRQAVSQLKSRKAAHIREHLTESCSSILLGYRQQCAAATRPTQLILPEAFRALPAYTLAILKTKPFKARNVSADVRNYMAHRFLSMGARALVQCLYPRVIPLHDLLDTIALPDPSTGKISFPAAMRNSYMNMTANGIYLADNEECLIIWVGSSTSPQLLQELFGVDDIMNIPTNLITLPNVDSRLSTQVRNIIAHHDARRGRPLKVYIARQNMDGIEIEFSDMLVEDQNNANMSYPDYLTVVHKSISHALTNGGGTFGSSTNLRGFAW